MYRGSLVTIRYQKPSDMEFLANFLNQDFIMEVNPDAPRFTYKERLEKEYKERFDKDGGSEIHLTIETLDGKVIGAIGADFVFWKNNFAFTYSYIGDPEYIEGGYWEEALKLFLEFGFNEMNIRKIKTSVMANNPKALEVYKNAGFQVEVVHKEDILKHGKYIDSYDMALFKDDYKA